MINEEKKKKEPINISSLIISIGTLVLGILLIFNGGEKFFDLLKYIISGVLMTSGVFKLIAYMFQKRKYDVPFTDLMSAIILIIFAIFIFVFGNVIEWTIQITLGILILVSGINRLILGLAVRTVDQEGSKVFTVVSVLMIVLGIMILTGKLLNFLGYLLIAYAISEIVGYIYYTSQKKDYSEVLNKEVPKEMKEKEAKEAVIEEK